MTARPCPFCAIAAGTSPAHVVLDEPAFLGFLDKRPLFPGHVLVVPRAHVETMLDLPSAQVGPLFLCAQRVASALEAGLGAEGTFVAVNNRISQSVPHLHVHVVPRRAKDGLRGFFWPRHAYDGDAEAARVAASIRGALPA